MKIWGFYKLDIYIIKKFLGTFFFSIILLLFIIIIFDISEKLDEFMEKQAPVSAIITEYYLNFIPYFVVLFAPLFTFIAVIFFTSKMAFNTEIIAILSNGVSFNRLLVPYLLSAIIIMFLNIYLGQHVIPHATKERQTFEEKYYNTRKTYRLKDTHKQIEPGVYVYMESYSTGSDFARRFSIEKFVGDSMVSKLLARDARWDTAVDKWKLRDYWIREYKDGEQIITTGKEIDSTLKLHPDEFKMRNNVMEAMDKQELDAFIENQKLQGSSTVTSLLVEKHRRISFPFSTLILTLIGVAVSSRKVRGGIGMHIGIGLLVAFSYIFFMQFSAQFAIGGALSPFLAMWVPNIIFAVVALLLYRAAPK